MRQDLDDVLCERYRHLFRDRHSNGAQSNMHRGFCCGDGWFDIIDTLCASLSAGVKVGAIPAVLAIEVKEKLGTLRFRIQGGNAEAHRLVALAEQKSARICELCGQPGMLQKLEGLQVLCPGCILKGDRR